MAKLSEIERTDRPQKRKHRRFDLRYPVHVKFALKNSVSELQAISDNISIGGVLLQTEAKIPQHCDVSFTMTVKGHRVIGPTKIVGEGQVVRVEPHHSGMGFAVAVQCKRPISKLKDYFQAQ